MTGARRRARLAGADRAASRSRRMNSHDDLLEDDAVIDDAGEEPVDDIEAGNAMDVGGGADEVCDLHAFEAGFGEAKARGIERTALMGDEHDAAKLVDLDEELEFIHDALLFKMRFLVAGETRGTAGERHAIVARETKSYLEKIVEVLADAAVGTIDCGGMDPLGFVGHAAFIGGHAGGNSARMRGIWVCYPPQCLRTRAGGGQRERLAPGHGAARRGGAGRELG